MNNDLQPHLRQKQQKISGLTTNGFMKHFSFSKEITQWNKNTLFKINGLIYLLFQNDNHKYCT